MMNDNSENSRFINDMISAIKSSSISYELYIKWQRRFEEQEKRLLNNPPENRV